MLFYHNGNILTGNVSNLPELESNIPEIEYLIDGEERYAMLPFHQLENSSGVRVIAVNQHGVSYEAGFEYKTLNLYRKVNLPFNRLKGFASMPHESGINNLSLVLSAWDYYKLDFKGLEKLLNKAGSHYYYFDLDIYSKRLKDMKPDEFNWIV